MLLLSSPQKSKEDLPRRSDGYQRVKRRAGGHERKVLHSRERKRFDPEEGCLYVPTIEYIEDVGFQVFQKLRVYT